MANAVQYHHGIDIDQFQLTTADITIESGVVADTFYSIKDSQDNIYVLCQKASNTKGKIIKITKEGIKTSFVTTTPLGGYASPFVDMKLSRDELFLFVSYELSSTTIMPLYIIPMDFSAQGTPFATGSGFANLKFAIYQDRYIWTASGSTVSVYDYATKALIDSETITSSSNYTLCVDVNNVSYLIYDVYGTTYLQKNVLNGSTITKTVYSVIAEMNKAKQMIIDKWGDLVILTNSGTASRLLKYTTAGVLIQDLDLSGVFYNLNTSVSGDYYYSNNLGTWKIARNTTQGQVFNTPTKIRTTGMVTYNNLITGYNQSVQC